MTWMACHSAMKVLRNYWGLVTYLEFALAKSVLKSNLLVSLFPVSGMRQAEL